MPNALARPEQTKFPVTRYPLFARSGHDAAELWLAGAPMTMADWRDLCLRSFLAGLGHFGDLAARTAAFHEAYAHRIGQAIVSRAEVTHG